MRKNKGIEIIRIQDIYNSGKVWIIKHYACGKYYWNQEICGKLFYSDFRRTTLRNIKAVGLMDMKRL